MNSETKALRFILRCKVSVYDTSRAAQAEAIGMTDDQAPEWSPFAVDLRQVSALRMPKRNEGVEDGRDVPEECYIYLKGGEFFCADRPFAEVMELWEDALFMLES